MSEDSVYRTDRNDGRFLSTNGFMHAHLKHMKPKLAFDPSMRSDDFPG